MLSAVSGVEVFLPRFCREKERCKDLVTKQIVVDFEPSPAEKMAEFQGAS